MSKRLIGVILSVIMCIMAAVPVYADTTTYTTIDSVTITLKYEDFKAGSGDDASNVDITLNDAHGLYEVFNSMIDVPTNGWAPGDVPNLCLTLIVNNEDTTRFSYSASRPSGVSVNGGDVHFGEIRSNYKRVYYEIHLSEVSEDAEEKWEDERDWNNEPGASGSGGPASQGAWLKDPNNGRYWYSNANGTRPINNWQQIGGVWYFFDATGFRVENQWIKWKGKDYYLGQGGRMYYNERTPDGYWVDKDGAWDGKPKS